MVMVAMAVDAMVAAWGVRRGGGAGCPGAQVQLVRAVLTVAVAVAVEVGGSVGVMCVGSWSMIATVPARVRRAALTRFGKPRNALDEIAGGGRVRGCAQRCERKGDWGQPRSRAGRAGHIQIDSHCFASPLQSARSTRRLKRRSKMARACACAAARGAGDQRLKNGIAVGFWWRFWFFF